MRDQRQRLAGMGQSPSRPLFYDDINEVMSGCNYQLISVAIRKDRLVAQYACPADPYDLSLLFALERLVSVLEANSQTDVVIVAEKRGAKEDCQLHVAFQRIVTSGSAYVDGARFRRINFTLRFIPKAMNIIGTQLADLAAYPVARYVLDTTKANPAFEVVQTKLCRRLKIFP